MEELLKLTEGYGFESVLLGLVIMAITELAKIPIKHYAKKQTLPKRVTRYIPIIPLVVGFGLTALLLLIKEGNVVFDDTYFELWICGTSLSLAIYACYDNFKKSGEVTFDDEFKTAVYQLLKTSLDTSKAEKLKELTESLATYYLTEEIESATMDAENLLKTEVAEENLQSLIEQLCEINAQRNCTIQESETTEESETVACTATERYEYELKKTTKHTESSRSSAQSKKEDN